MLEWKQRLAHWEGTAEELGLTAQEIAREIDLDAAGPETTPFNERLIRSYVQANAIDRPERRGREAYFGFRQLVQCLAVRVLLNDGWPLVKIAEYIQLTPFESLLELLPKPGSATAVQSLVKRFQRERGIESSQVLESRASYAPHPGSAELQGPVPPSPPSSPSRPASSSLADHSADLLRRRQQQQGIAASIARASATATRESDLCVRIELAPGCQVYVDRELLRQLSSEQADQLGQALSHALIDRRLTTKGDRK